MEEAIRSFPKQFAWDPIVENEGRQKGFQRYILAGMGGSHVQGDILKTVAPERDLVIHRDYGLPLFSREVLSRCLLIASSYSGNTEETISAFKEGMQRGMPVAAISTGGQLLELAEFHRIPYIKIPDTGIQPRMALGFSFRALAKMMGREDLLESSGRLAFELKAKDFEKQGKKMGEALYGRIPVMYASQKNYAVAYIWKVTVNESAKIPAFFNVLPELNHNEMTGFDARESTKSLSEKFHVVLLEDLEDHPKIQKRMKILKELYKTRGLGVSALPLEGRTMLHKIFSSFLLANWTAHALALQYGTDPEQVPMVEEFKKLIASRKK